MRNRLLSLLSLLLCFLLLLSCSGEPEAQDEYKAPVATAPTYNTQKTPEEEGKQESVNLLDYQEYVYGEDWAFAIEEAFNHTDVIYIPAGEYGISSVEIPDGKTIMGDGAATVLRALNPKVSMFTCTGFADHENPLAEDLENFTDTLQVKKANTVEEGDLVLLLSQRNCTVLEDTGYDWCLGRAYEGGRTTFFSEFKTVKHASGTTVVLDSATIFPNYLASNDKEVGQMRPDNADASWKPYLRESTTIQRINTAKDITLKDFSMIVAQGSVGINVNYGYRITVSGIQATTPAGEKVEKNTRMMTLMRSVDCTVENCSFTYGGEINFSYQTATVADDYNTYTPIVVQACESILLDGCTIRGGTHGVYVGTVNKGGLSQKIKINGCHFSDIKWAGVYVSSGCYDTEITKNTIIDCAQGIKHGSRKTYIAENDISLNVPVTLDFVYCHVDQGGTAGIMLIEGYCIDSVVEKNTIRNARSGIVIRDGGEKTNIFEMGNITIRENLIEGCVNGIFTWKHAANKASLDLDVNITDNTFRQTENTTALYGVYLCRAIKGVTMANNTFEGFVNTLYLGDFVSDVTLEANTLKDGARFIWFAVVSAESAALPEHQGLSTVVTLKNNTLNNVTSQYLNHTQSHIKIQ